jgi:ubiquinone/menaquinone biosynthesis C-methylase UbiE
MLSPGFPKVYADKCKLDYIAPQELINLIQSSNQSFNTGHEIRLQSIYAYDLWERIEAGGLLKSCFENTDVLEICAGTGFLTYHLLSKVTPSSLVINDISENEIANAKLLIKNKFPEFLPEWAIGDIHTFQFNKKFDIIIGNSFIHHFYNVPLVLERIHSLLKPGGVFISTGEPTFISPYVEGRKFYFWPLATLFPKLFLCLLRYKNTSVNYGTDVWVFNPKKLSQVAYKAGFSKCTTVSFNLLRSIISTIFKIRLSESKNQHTKFEIKLLKISIKIDRFLSKFLPSQSFASFTFTCRK